MSTARSSIIAALWLISSLALATAGAKTHPFMKACQSPPSAAAKRTVAAVKAAMGLKGCAATLKAVEATPRLWLNRHRIRDLGPLAGFTHLRELDLEDNDLRDIRPLGGLTRLRHLWLGENFINDISILENLRALEVLVLEDNRIQDLTPLGALVKLQAVDVSRNPVADLAPLAALPQLVSLFADHTRVASLAPWAAPRPRTGPGILRLSLIATPLARPPWEGGAIRTPQSCPDRGPGDPAIRRFCAEELFGRKITLREEKSF